MASSDLSERLLVTEAVVSCERCELHAQCTAPVAFAGPTPARIAVIGEAPGRQEDEQGKPFVGPAGRMIRKHLGLVGIDPETVAWINTVSCFPHGTPSWENIDACAVNKAAQLDVADPQFVLLLGKVALKATMRTLEITRSRGRPFVIDDRVHFATYHPAAALRNGNYEAAMHDDLETFKAIVDAGSWFEFVPDTCCLCPVELQHFSDEGLGWCGLHAPQICHDRAAVAARELDEARARVAALNQTGA